MSAAILWFIVLLLPWHPWLCREQLEAGNAEALPEAGDITVLIPARNEEKTIAATLRGIACQGSGIHVVMVDDESTDDTCRIARKTMQKAMIVQGTPLPPGWTGKLWALEQGRPHVQTPFTLLLDADIELRPGIIPAMLKKMRANELSMLSLLAAPNMSSVRERSLMPAFVYFFKLLYPFVLFFMWISYVPVLGFYGRSPLWGIVLPLIAVWYLVMTWLSAFRYWKGEQSRWKGRCYMRSDSGPGL